MNEKECGINHRIFWKAWLLGTGSCQHSIFMLCGSLQQTNKSMLFSLSEFVRGWPPGRFFKLARVSLKLELDFNEVT